MLSVNISPIKNFAIQYYCFICMANLGISVCVCVMPQVRAFLTRDRPCPHIVSGYHVDVNVCVVFSHTFDVIACPTPVHGKLPSST